jgi:hypothetical protein
LESIRALNTPLISSMTKRGKNTALSMPRVVPATRSAATPLNWLPAAWAVASGRAGGAARQRVAARLLLEQCHGGVANRHEGLREAATLLGV